MTPKVSVITSVRAKDAEQAAWLHEAIASVHDQTFSDWEMVIVDDHSPANLATVKAAWPRVRWLDAAGQGVSAGRNQAAEATTADLLLPLDGDDKLAPDALAKFLQAWTERGEAGIIYSDVVMFGQDYSQVYLSPEYHFPTLLRATFMTVGSLHRKADWEKVGGWRLDMSQGLEDWEYWIALGEMGVCGKRLPEPLYWYRRHPRGRLQWLKANRDLWDRAYQTMRTIHKHTYDGRYPMGCCGGKAPKGAQRPRHGGVPRAPQAKAVPMPPGTDVPMVYRGSRLGDFMIVSGVTRTRYRVPGKGQMVMQADGRPGVKPADVVWFRSVAQGQDFQVVTPPKPAPDLKAAPAPPVEAPRAAAPSWSTAILEGQAPSEQAAAEGTNAEKESDQAPAGAGATEGQSGTSENKTGGAAKRKSRAKKG